MPKKPDDQYGYDDRRHRARTSLDRMKQQVENRPDKPARKLGDVLPDALKKTITPTNKRLSRACAEIRADPPDDLMFMHTVMCQAYLPYRETDERDWRRREGNVSLLIEAGRIQDHVTGEWAERGLPYGEKSRLILMYLNGEALRTKSPVIHMGRSLKQFAIKLQIDPNGRNLKIIRNQLECLAAAHITFGMDSGTYKTDVIDAYSLWRPDDAMRRAPWPSTVRLAPRYFETLMKHAVPLDSRAIGALAHSALDLDIYAWLAQRLWRIPENEEQLVSWQALKAQFGPDYDRLRKFREKFLLALTAVEAVYRDAKIEKDNTGLLLRYSPPPVPQKPQGAVLRLDPLTIDSTATEIPNT